MKIFFSAGEPSGDLHGANLIRALHKRYDGVQAVGYGGPLMAQAGCELHEDLTRYAVMWFLRVLLKLHVFIGLLWRADRYFRRENPDAVVLIDYPGFNWWIARRAKAHGIPVHYYAPPQIWGWASWRVKKMQRLVDHVYCSLPFEQRWLRERGCQATFVGHPYFDEVRARRLDVDFLREHALQPGPLVALLPGSRDQEVAQNLSTLVNAASQIREKIPQARFIVASFRSEQTKTARDEIKRRQLPIEVHVGRTAEVIHLAECCLAVSGSVSLELLYHTVPTVIVYRISAIAFFVQNWLRRVKYITLVNLLHADDVFREAGEDTSQAQSEALFPEYLTRRDPSQDMARHVITWLSEPARREQCVHELELLKQQVAHGGASSTAASLILKSLGWQEPKRRETHPLRDAFRSAAPDETSLQRSA